MGASGEADKTTDCDYIEWFQCFRFDELGAFLSQRHCRMSAWHFCLTAYRACIGECFISLQVGEFLLNGIIGSPSAQPLEGAERVFVTILGHQPYWWLGNLWNDIWSENVSPCKYVSRWKAENVMLDQKSEDLTHHQQCSQCDKLYSTEN